MSVHRITYETVSSLPPARHRAWCKCRGWASAVHPTRQLVEDEAIVHLRNVEKARAARAHGTPSLASQARYYREKAESIETPESDRPLWAQLAAELEHRCGNDAVASRDVALPFD